MTGESTLHRLVDLVGDGDVVVLAGAGMSTESGIPDYRGPASRSRPVTPMTIKTFRSGASAQQRYWARSHLGWPRFDAARPNPAHDAVTSLQRNGLLAGIITQNVDGLQQQAGARDVVELHGALRRVRCLGCEEVTSRDRLHERLREANPGWRPATVGALNPDGDVELDDAAVGGFHTVGCETCGAALRPDVVFFGETVTPDVVGHCEQLVDDAGSLLVLGSSLTVMSGYRFVLRAAAAGIPVAIVNDGPTRGDDRARLTHGGRLGSVLPVLAAQLPAPLAV